MGFYSNNGKGLPVPRVAPRREEGKGGREEDKSRDREQDQEVKEMQENSEACSTNILQIGIQTNTSQDDG